MKRNGRSRWRGIRTKEARREDGIQVVSIATPNSTHFAICKAALEAGLHVVCEKPLCFSVDEAKELQALARERERIKRLLCSRQSFVAITVMII